MKKESLQKAADLLRESKLQLEYLSEKFGETGTTNSVPTRIDAGIAEIDRELDEQESRDSMYAGFKYPPCDMSDAQVGDTVELWNEEVGEVVGFGYDLGKTIEVKFNNIGISYSWAIDGIYDGYDPDDALNVRRLIKKQQP